MKGTIDRDVIKLVVEMCLKSYKPDLKIPVGVSNRHVHLNRADMDILFGKGYELTFYKPLSQKGYFAAKEAIEVVGPKGKISNVRLLGPLREHTQVELLLSDERKLGIDLSLRDSGELEETQPVTLIGPNGTVVNSTGIMAALRHIHMSYLDAFALGLQEGSRVSVKTEGARGLTLDNVKVRLGNFMTELHLDTDEAFAAQLRNGDKAIIIL